MGHQSIAVLVIGALVHVVAVSEPALAMSAAENRDEQVRAAMMKMEVGRDTRVSVKLRDDHTVVGYLAAVSDHSFFVTDPERHVSTQIPYRNIKQMRAIADCAKEVITDVLVVVLVVIGVVIYTRYCPKSEM